MTRAERLRGARRQQVLTAARDLFAEKGYHATSIHDIIAKADIARGTFYLYFESKRAIFAELLDGFFATLSAAVRRIDTALGAPPPLVQMQVTVERIFAALRSERALTRILIREAVGLDIDFDRKLTDFYGRVTDLIARALQEGISMGLVRPCNPEIASWCVLGSVKELVDRLVVVGEAIEAKSAERELISFVLSGVFLPIASSFGPQLVEPAGPSPSPSCDEDTRIAAITKLSASAWLGR